MDETDDPPKANSSVTRMTNEVAYAKGFLFPILEFIQSFALVFSEAKEFQLLVVLPE
jgi:hypothetical protein